MSGWSIIDPRWLWALGALALPVIVHLISRGTARRVAVGSVDLLRARTSRRARRLRPTQPLLLALRCLLLVALALALAGLLYARPGGTAGERRWGLVSAAVVAERAASELDATTATRLDTLLAAGRLRRMEPGLPVVRRWPEPIRESGHPATLEAPAEDVWSYLREVAAMAPPGTGLEVFAHDRLAHLAGARPTLALAVKWPLLAPASRMPRPEPPTPAEPDARRTATSATLRVVVRHGADRGEDAAYIAAALRAVAAVPPWSDPGPWTLEIAAPKAVRDDHEPALEPLADLGAASMGAVLIWLADEPLPAAWEAAVRAGAVLLRDDGGPWSECATSVAASEGRTDIVPVVFRLSRCLTRFSTWRSTVVASPVLAPEDEATAGHAVWRDAHGRAVLSRARRGAGHVWALAGRFHPSWSSLVLSPTFPRWLSRWLVDAARWRGLAPTVAEAHDPRPAGDQRWPRQVADQRGTGPADVVPASAAPIRSPPRPSPLWWLVAALTAVERFVALRRA